MFNQNLLITSEHSLADAAKIIRSEPERVAIVSDENKRLIGVVSDADIRAGLLNNYSPSQPVRYCMQSAPNFDLVDGDSEYHQSVMQEFGLRHLVLLDKMHRVSGIALAREPIVNPEEHTVVVMAGGLGSRLRPITEQVPKPMIEIAGKPILARIVQNFADQGFRKFIFTLNYLGEKIEKYFGDGEDFGVQISYVHEEKKLGTAGSLSLLSERPAKPFFVVNGDVLTSLDYLAMPESHVLSDSMSSVAVNRYSEQIQYGVLTIERGRVKQFEEKPLVKFFANSGIYMLNPQILRSLSVGEYLDMPSLLDEQIESGAVVSAFPLHEYWIDIGRPQELERAEAELSSD